MKFSSFLWLMVLYCPYSSGQDVSGLFEAFEFIHLGVATLKYVKDVWMEAFPDSIDLPIPEVHFPSNGKEILGKFDDLVARLKRLQLEVTDLSRSLNQIPDMTKSHLKWEVRLNSLENLVRPIDVLFERFQQYSVYKESIEPETLKEFCASVTSHSTRSILNLLDEIHHFVIDLKNGRDGIFDHLKNVLQSTPTFHCTSHLTAQQSLYALYELLSLADVKGYTMVQFAYMYMKKETSRSYDKEIELANTNHLTRVLEKITAVKSVINSVSDLYYRCDPPNHVQNKTYHQFTRVMQGYVENEVDLSPTESCTESCPYFQVAEKPGCYENPKTRFCNLQERCRGKILDCKYEYADSVVCRSNSINRRYDYIKFDNGVTYGEETRVCYNPYKVDSWWRWFVHCSFCFCLCDDPSDVLSHRFISLRPSLSDIDSNKIVTGVRFLKKGNMLHLNVQQGTALPSGGIDATSVEWYNDSLFTSNSQGIIENEDYVSLKWNERTFDLDLLEAPKGFVITGVQFKKLGTHLGLKIRVTRIIFIDGKLQPEVSHWVNSIVTPLSSESPRLEYDVSNLNVPTRAVQGSTMKSSNNSFIQISPTSAIHDASQTAIPFIDAQPVELRTPLWLNKMGLYYKNSGDYGGFMGVQVGTIQMGDHIDVPKLIANIPTEDKDINKYNVDVDVINLADNEIV